MYRWAFGLSPPPPGGPYALAAAGVPDGDTLAAGALEARRAREAASLASFAAGVGARVDSLAAAQAWLFREHGAYAPRVAPREAVDAALLASY